MMIATVVFDVLSARLGTVLIAALAVCAFSAFPATAGSERLTHIPVSGVTRPPIGWNIVRDKNDESRAVLTVTTDNGDYVLDNQNKRILLWWKTGYRFVKRQSRSDPNVWVSLGNTRPAIATATSR
jgi:hypothetical protein